jgi:hypothetical protein
MTHEMDRYLVERYLTNFFFFLARCSCYNTSADTVEIIAASFFFFFFFQSKKFVFEYNGRKAFENNKTMNLTFEKVKIKLYPFDCLKPCVEIYLDKLLI